MIGLIYIFAFVVYVLLTILVSVYAAKKARQRGIAGWKWGIPTAFLMYLILFWDHIPTLVAHKYYCEKEAGFKVYKTLEEWKKENPGVVETLTYHEIPNSEKYDDDYIYHLNERFDWHIDNEPIFLSLKRVDNQIVDVSNGEALSQHIDFKTGWGSIAIGANRWREYKIWLVSESCEFDRKSRKNFYAFENQIKNLGRNE